MAFPLNPNIEYSGNLFRLGTIPAPATDLSSTESYEFVQRIGMTVVIPVDESGNVYAIRNNRPYYGETLGFPGGNLDGTFEDPELPEVGGSRELLEEMGMVGDIQTFMFPSISSTIDYCRFLIIARGAKKIQEPTGPDAAQITHSTMKSRIFIDNMNEGTFPTPYPDLELAIVRAVGSLGASVVTDWLVRGVWNEEVTNRFGNHLIELN